MNRSTPSPLPSPALGAGEKVPEGRVRGWFRSSAGEKCFRGILSRIRHFVAAVAAIALVAGAQPAHACAVCFGKSDSKLVDGMYWGILSLLVVVACVLGGIAAFFIYLARRSAMVAGANLAAAAAAETNKA